MTYKTKRSLAQLGKHARNMPKLQHPDEAPTPSKQRCSHGYPVRRPPTRRRPRRTPPSAPPARPPSARPCAPSRPSSSWPTCTRCYGRRQPPPNACHAYPLHFLQDAHCLMTCWRRMVLMEA